jgi:hypothetical protein
LSWLASTVDKGIDYEMEGSGFESWMGVFYLTLIMAHNFSLCGTENHTTPMFEQLQHVLLKD